MSDKKGSFNGLELEIHHSLLEKKSISSETDLLKSLENLLFDFNDNRETYPVSDDSIFNRDVDNKNFEIKTKALGNLIPSPNKKYPIQLIQCHFAKNAEYHFNYIDNSLTLDVEYKMFDDFRVITGVKQKNKIIDLELNGTGETFYTKVILIYINKEGKEKG